MNNTSIFEEMEAAGSTIPKMVRELHARGWITYKHHDNWIKKEWENDPDVNSKGLDTYSAYLNAIELPAAMKVLTTALSKDKSEGSYYFSWQSNIAMAFYDEYRRRHSDDDDLSNQELADISNLAAIHFLDLLIR